MPQKTSRKNKHSQKRGPDKMPEKSLDSIGVRECLVWPPQGGGAEPILYDPDVERETKFLLKKGELGKPMNRGYVLPEEDTQQHVEDEGTVIEALRGWPNNRKSSPQDMEPSHDVGDNTKGFRACDSRGKTDPPMVYLVAHKYMSDYERQRMEEAQLQRQQREGKYRSKKLGNDIDVKTTKGAQMRAIHLAGQTKTDPKDLWQMSKFKKAKSGLDTFRKNEKKANRKGKELDGSDDSTCGLNMNVSGPAVEDTLGYGDDLDREIAALCDG